MNYSFGEFLSIKRKEKGLTQKEVAERLFISESAVSKWEQGRSHPDITVLPVLAQLLEVSEHELITASVDSVQRENNKKAKKWSRLTLFWNLFFYIAYGITILTCFICNLAVSGTLSWFWIVLGSIILASTFTTLPQFIKKARLFKIVLCELLALLALLGICCIFTGGNWFFITAFPIITGFAVIFLPIYIKLYNFPAAIKAHRQIFCVLIDTLCTLGMLYVIEGYSDTKWVNGLALPLLAMHSLIALFIIAVIKYLKLNRFFKASILLGFFALYYPSLILLCDYLLEKSLSTINTESYKINLRIWNNTYINGNVSFLIVLTLLVLAFAFLSMGILKAARKKNS